MLHVCLYFILLDSLSAPRVQSTGLESLSSAELERLAALLNPSTRDRILNSEFSESRRRTESVNELLSFLEYRRSSNLVRNLVDRSDIASVLSSMRWAERSGHDSDLVRDSLSRRGGGDGLVGLTKPVTPKPVFFEDEDVV
jgi:hypothetical protein